VLRGLLTRHPVHIWNQESAELRRTLESLMMTDPPDVFVAESTFVARYLDLVPSSVPRVIDTHNVDSVTFSRYVSALRFGLRRAYATITARKLAAFEKATYRDASGVWVCSDIERDLVRDLAPSTPVWTVPNGVDTGYFQPDDSPPAADRVLFFGRLDYYPNVDGLEFFVRDILPVLKRRRPGIQLHIVGSGSTAGIESLVAADPAVRVIGRVADLRGALRSASVVVVPLRVGGGTRLKVLEALSMARPVVSTTIGAEGIDVRSGEHLVLADRADAFATAVADLLDDPAAALAMGRAGRRLVTARYDWSRIGGMVAGSLRELAATDAE
jgi:glycosyltransferase involved in cell wall biosynthesis